MFIYTLTLSLLLVGFISFLASKKSYISFPIPAEERLSQSSIKLIVESNKTRFTN